MSFSVLNFTLGFHVVNLSQLINCLEATKQKPKKKITANTKKDFLIYLDEYKKGQHFHYELLILLHINSQKV